ncbi:hypothetical protein [Janthinobacterium sp. JC611]|uniref:hypothetical protein n=1 Tax=Janthinobacterium sp. JC611 TaxID=2816201 RepID=UPI001BFDC161|nr:hypothetical protein [Janthinobacterium sp. JC611]
MAVNFYSGSAYEKTTQGPVRYFLSAALVVPFLGRKPHACVFARQMHAGGVAAKALFFCTKSENDRRKRHHGAILGFCIKDVQRCAILVLNHRLLWCFIYFYILKDNSGSAIS